MTDPTVIDRPFVDSPFIDRIAELAAEYDRSAAFPAESLRIAHEAGLLTATIGERYGGRGGGVADTARILHSLGRLDPSVALITAMTLNTHARQAAQPHWPEELYARVVKESLERPVLVNHARVEPDLGSSARGGLPATRARRTADGWAVSGTKRFVTGADGLDWFLVWATTDEAEPRVGTFLVPGGSPGIEVTDRWDQLGLRASGSHDVTFREVEVPYEHVIGIGPHGPAAEQDNRAGAALHLPLPPSTWAWRAPRSPSSTPSPTRACPPTSVIRWPVRNGSGGPQGRSRWYSPPPSSWCSTGPRSSTPATPRTRLNRPSAHACWRTGTGCGPWSWPCGCSAIRGWPAAIRWSGTSATSSARPCTRPRRTFPCSRSERRP